MYIDIVPNRKSKPAYLLRESYRAGDKVKKRTVANLSSLSPEQLEDVRLVLKGRRLAPVDELFEAVRSPHHGHVQAVLLAIRRLGLERLIAPGRSRERDLVVAMIVARVVVGCSKLATTLWWNTTSLPETLGLGDADEDDLYEAMDWLLARQGHVEKKLADRHFDNDALALYDLSSSYFEGDKCPLAARGHNRDGKEGKLQVNYGLLTDALFGLGHRLVHPVERSGSTGSCRDLKPVEEKGRMRPKRSILKGDGPSGWRRASPGWRTLRSL